MDVITLEGVTKRFGDFTALDDATLAIEEGRLTGIVGRNGAGKSTLFDLVAGRSAATSGSVRVLGEDPFENRRVLGGVCAITEDQPYPGRFSVEWVLRSAKLLYPQWDDALSNELIEEFGLHRRQKVGKLSRGQRSALGVVLALSSKAPIMVLDEPYVGLDAVARGQFYGRLLDEMVTAPRTCILSSHLVDEVAHLLDHLVVIDRGRIVLNAPVDEVRDSVLELTGPAVILDAYAAGVQVLSRHDLGGVARVTVRGASAEEAAAQGLRVRSLSLQEVVVALAATSSDAATDPVGKVAS